MNNSKRWKMLYEFIKTDDINHFRRTVRYFNKLKYKYNKQAINNEQWSILDKKLMRRLEKLTKSKIK